MKIKVCGMKYSSNIRDVLALKPDYLGFIFYAKSPRFVDEKPEDKLLESWSESTKKVGVFVDAPWYDIKQKCEEYQLDMVQCHGHESPDLIEKIKAHGREVVKVFHLNTEEDLQSTERYEAADFFLFDTPGAQYGGTGKTFDWSVLKNYDGHKPYFLSGGIGSHTNLDFERASIPIPYALDVNSCFEDKPGYKNLELLTPFINQVHGL